MLVPLGAIAEDAAVNCGPGDLHHSKLLHYRLVERLLVPLVGFADEDAKHLRGSLLPFMWNWWLRLHGLSRQLDDVSILHLDQPIAHYVVELGKHLLHLLRGCR